MGAYEAAMSRAVSKFTNLRYPEGTIHLYAYSFRYGLDAAQKEQQASSLRGAFAPLLRDHERDLVILTELFREHVTANDPFSTALYELESGHVSVLPCDDVPTYLFHMTSNHALKNTIRSLSESGAPDIFILATTYLHRLMYFAASLERSAHMFSRVMDQNSHNPAADLSIVSGGVHITDFTDISSAIGVLLDVEHLNTPANHGSMLLAKYAEMTLHQFKFLFGKGPGDHLRDISGYHAELLRQTFNRLFSPSGNPVEMLPGLYRSMADEIRHGFLSAVKGMSHA